MIPVPERDPLSMVWLDTNDLGNAERLVRLARGLLLWVEEIGWVGYDGKRWSARDGARMAARLAHEVARHVDAEANALDEVCEDAAKLKTAFGWNVPIEVAGERVTALRKHAIRSGNSAATKAMLEQARTLLPAYREEFDTDPYAINLQNGTLRFVKGVGGWTVALGVHEPEDRFMQIANFSYDPKATAPDWIERMVLVQPEDDQRGKLQQIYGYCLTGLTSEQKFFLYQGRGGDGKSLTNAVIAECLGDYHRHAQVESFLEGGSRSGSDHSSDMARLQGDIRMVTCDEPKRNSAFNGTRIKQITGGKVTCRPLGKVEIEYSPHWKLIMECNPLPAVPTDDDGFWRRCDLNPWPYQFDKGGEKSEPFEILVERFVAQGSGILNWMIDGALTWLATRRLPPSRASAEAVDNYRQSSSPIGEWLAECCEVTDRGAMEPARPLYNHFKAWCEKTGAGGDKPPTETMFGRALRDRQILVVKDARTGNRMRKGIRLKLDGPFRDLGSSTGDAGGGGSSVAGAAGPASSGGAQDPGGDLWKAERDDDDFVAF